ncbi:MAG TPA: CapA family protein [Solirubrobacter sp.]|nr:CapA family protein [Solirubrobacter sp.]
MPALRDRPGLVVAVAALAAAFLGAPHADAATLAWGGDLTLGSSYGLPPDGGRPLLAAGAGVLRSADVAAVNYEGTFGAGGASKCGGGAADCFAFQAPARNAFALPWAGVDVVNHANNHAYDFGPAGWRASRAALSRAGVRATGAPGEIVVLRRGGLRFAFAGFSTYRWTNAMSDAAGVRRVVRAAAARADVVVAFLHAGAEGADRTHVPRGHEHAFGEDRGDSRRFARAAIDAGADLVLGSGPHVLRGLELYHERLIAYSLGNLAGWHNFGVGGRSALSALLTVAVDERGRFVAARIASYALDGAGVPHADPHGRAAALMAALSRTDFPGSRLEFDRLGNVSIDGLVSGAWPPPTSP